MLYGCVVVRAVGPHAALASADRHTAAPIDCRRATDAYRREAAVANPLYTVGEHSRQSFGFGRHDADGDRDVEAMGRLAAARDGGAHQSAETARGPAALTPATEVHAFSDIERTQRLAVNVSDDSPLLKRSDKCCNAGQFDAAKCCRPHAVFWQSG